MADYPLAITIGEHLDGAGIDWEFQHAGGDSYAIVIGEGHPVDCGPFDFAGHPLWDRSVTVAIRGERGTVWETETSTPEQIAAAIAAHSQEVAS